MRILLIGDIVGKPGRKIVARALPGLRLRERLDFVIANGENCADGSGITPAIYRALLKCGVDCVTLGDHIYRRQEIEDLLRTEDRVVKPANFPPEAPGRDHTIVTSVAGVPVLVVSLMGRVFMKPVDCPFKAADRILATVPEHVRVRIVDLHAEATSDKQLIGRYLDGRVSAVLGTHTHVPTADETILPGGTAFQCDVGMTGPHDSILGRRIDRVTHTTITFEPTHFDVATDDVRINGSIVEVDEATGRAISISRLRIDEAESFELAELAPREPAPPPLMYVAAKGGPVLAKSKVVRDLVDLFHFFDDHANLPQTALSCISAVFSTLFDLVRPLRRAVEAWPLKRK